MVTVSLLSANHHAGAAYRADMRRFSPLDVSLHEKPGI
jgi:hypothetical protein